MEVNSSPAPNAGKTPKRNPEVVMRVRVKSMELPPIKDGLVVGNKAAIGIDAMLRTLTMLTPEEFERLHLTDDLIEDVIVRTSILKKAGRERLVKFVVHNLKPLMIATELLMLDMHLEVVIEDDQ